MGIFHQALSSRLQKTGSLEDLIDWLKAQPYIVEIETTDYLIKTAPARKEIIVIFMMENGSTLTKVIDIILYPDQTFGLGEIHDW